MRAKGPKLSVKLISDHHGCPGLPIHSTIDKYKLTERVSLTWSSIQANCQALAPNPKTKGPRAYTKISWATTMPAFRVDKSSA